MDTNIISRVSQIILENHLGIKYPRSAPPASVAADKVEISQAALQANLVSHSMNEEDSAARKGKVESVRKNVETKNYKMSSEMAEDIAQKIANMFI